MIFNLYVLKKKFEKLNLTLNLEELIDLKLNDKYSGNVTQEIRERIDLELQYITDNNYLNLFKLAYLIADDSIKSNNLIRFRGWSSSFIAYLLDISFINPLKFNIPIESFTYSLFFKSSFRIETSDSYLSSDNNVHNIMEENSIEYKTVYSPSEQTTLEYNEDYYCFEFYDTTNMDKLTKLKNMTNVDFTNINLDDIKIYNYINDVNTNILGMSKTLELLKKIKPYNLDTLLKFSGVQSSQVDYYLKIFDEWDFKDIPTTREDVFDYLLNKGIDRSIAIDIALKYMSIKSKDIWKTYKEVLLESSITENYIDFIEDHKYCLFSKHSLLERAILVLWIIWFKIYYKEVSEQIEKQELISYMLI